ncbi:MAG: SDR family oxidoreductase [Gemmatimonadaceae bacterium]|nr:SDR family oxidoreductase [Gemmatimonadaceae bacterium]
MKILLAGGAGYIGSVLAPKLLDRGYEVDVVDLLWFGNQLPPAVRVIEKDILDLTEGELVGYDQVVFLAGLSNDPMADYSPSRNFVFNAASPAFLAYLAKRAGVKRYVYASSCSVYGYTENELYNEQSPANSSYPYGISKLQGEFGAMQTRDDNFSVIALRKGTVCGYSPRMRLDLVVNTMFRTAVTDGVINVANPAIWRPILAIQDAASAYIRAIEASPSISGIFNVASGNFTIGEVADHVHDSVKDLLSLDTRLNINHVTDVRNYKVTSEHAQNVLGFNPTQTIRDIVRELVDNYAKFKDVENPAYYNIQTFKRVDGTPKKISSDDAADSKSRRRTAQSHSAKA